MCKAGYQGDGKVSTGINLLLLVCSKLSINVFIELIFIEYYSNKVSSHIERTCFEIKA